MKLDLTKYEARWLARYLGRRDEAIRDEQKHGGYQLEWLSGPHDVDERKALRRIVRKLRGGDDGARQRGRVRRGESDSRVDSEGAAPRAETG